MPIPKDVAESAMEKIGLGVITSKMRINNLIGLQAHQIERLVELTRKVGTIEVASPAKISELYSELLDITARILTVTQSIQSEVASGN